MFRPCLPTRGKKVPDRASVLFMTPSDEYEQHKLKIDLKIGNGEEENIRDIIYNEFDGNLDKVYPEENDSDSDPDSDDEQKEYFESKVSTVNEFKKENGEWVAQGKKRWN